MGSSSPAHESSNDVAHAAEPFATEAEKESETELSSTVEYEAVGESSELESSHLGLVASFEHHLSNIKTSRRLSKAFAKATRQKQTRRKESQQHFQTSQNDQLSDFEARLLHDSQRDNRRLSRTPPPSQPLQDAPLQVHQELISHSESVRDSELDPSLNHKLDHELLPDELDVFPPSTGESSPVDVSFTDSMVSTGGYENDFHPEGEGFGGVEDDEFPLHTIVLSKKSPKRQIAYSPVETIDTIRNNHQELSIELPSISEPLNFDSSAPSGTYRFDMDFGNSFASSHDPSNFIPSFDDSVSIRTDPVAIAASEFSGTPRPTSSIVSSSTTTTAKAVHQLPSQPHTHTQGDSQYIHLAQDLHLYKTALQTTRNECDSLKERVATMQSCFDDAVRKEVESLEVELESEYTLKFEAFKLEYQEYLDAMYLSRVQNLSLSGEEEDRNREQRGGDEQLVSAMSLDALQRENDVLQHENDTLDKENHALRDENARNAETVSGLKQKLDHLLKERQQLEKDVSSCQAELEEAAHQQEVQNAQIKQILSLLEQATQERCLLHDQLVQEKAKTSRNEEEFRLFGKKLRGLQDLNSELRNENEELRTELRKLQYEGTTASEKDDYYKAKLDQARFDNESLRAVIASLTNQQPQDAFRSSISSGGGTGESRNNNQSGSSSTPTDASPPYSKPQIISPRYRQSMPDFRSTSNNIFPSSVVTTATTSSRIPMRSAETTPIKQHQRLPHQYQPQQQQHAWTPQSQHLQQQQQQQKSPSINSLRATPTTGDRERFLDKLRRYEEEDNEDDEEDKGSIGDTRSINSNFFRMSVGESGARRSDGRDGGLVSSGGGRRVSSSGVFGTDRAALASSGRDNSSGSSVDYVAIKAELDVQLRTLTDKKAVLISELQRIPAMSGSSRRRKEQLDDELDGVERAIGGVKMKMRNMNLL
ncbi:UNVERIFIED_CONTAM: hypothetical protein HDU68_002869 [Siphonaria sp. JEL0065]|nr:hypothetical protein HDU68_002869 [Siphonaria sp. JEL0065]